VRVFATAEALGEYAARRIWDLLVRAQSARGTMTLGCPGGRSGLATYAALARSPAAGSIDGRLLHIVMMDEYVEERGGSWVHCSPQAHFSCRRFGEEHIRRPLNGVLMHPIPWENLHVPDAATPEAYERRLEDLGGIDLFLLASGASDGHIAFNPPGTPRDASTRRVALAETTRRDNMATFPAFRSLDEVPTYGVTVGPATIAHHSRAALMLLVGESKREASRRITGARDYEADWPATIVRACTNAGILMDQGACPPSWS
jgi:glucosamine-6-phosphate deaminase